MGGLTLSRGAFGVLCMLSLQDSLWIAWEALLGLCMLYLVL